MDYCWLTNWIIFLEITNFYFIAYNLSRDYITGYKEVLRENVCEWVQSHNKKWNSVNEPDTNIPFHENKELFVFNF